MFIIYFKTATRQLLKNRLFSFVNIAGLSVGLASIMALSVLVYQYLATDNYQKGISQMYYLKTKGKDGSQYAATPYPLLGEIVKNCPEVEAATHIQSWYYPWLKWKDKEFQETTDYVDTGYFGVFQYPFKYGNPATALHDKFSIVLSEEIAEKFFGNQNPVGRVVTADDTIQLTVTGVLQHVPANTSIRPSVLIPTTVLEDNFNFKSGANWYNTFASGYIRLKKNSSAKQLEKKMAAITKLNYPDEQKSNTIRSVPFADITKEASPVIGVIMKGAVGAGIFVLLIILLNLINLNTAGIYTRTKEVAIRQMMGGNKRNIILQFCIENGLLIAISFGFAWLLFSLVLFPGISDLAKENLREIETGVSHNYPLIFLFVAIGVLFTIAAASLPALQLIRIKVTEAVKGKLTSGHYKSSRVRNVFITIQFVFAVALICIAIILRSQIGFMKSSSLGFNQDNVAVANIDLAYRDLLSAAPQIESILNELKANPHVKSVSLNGVVPTQYWENFNTYYEPATHKEVYLKQASADAGYITTYRIPLIQGKNFDDALAASEKDAVFINRAAMKAFGWTNAIGKQIKSKGENTPYTVIGVVEDFHYGDLSKKIEPLVQWYSGKFSVEQGSLLSVRTDAGYTDKIMQSLGQSFKAIPSRRAFGYELMSDKVNKQYALLDGILKITNYIALLTILIAAMGMFGLIALFARMRVKEIGIRKVLDASVASITGLLSKDFLLLVCLSILIATPLSYYIMSNWLQDFAYRITISGWMFVLGGAVAVVIALLTVSMQAIKAAIANPVKSLRTE